MNNTIFGKTMANMGKYRDVKFMMIEKKDAV